MDHLIVSSIQVVKVVILSFEDNAVRIGTHNIFSKGRNKRLQGHNLWSKIFNHPVKNEIRTYKILRNVAAGQGDDYTTGCLLYYQHFKENVKPIAIDLTMHQALDIDPKIIQ